MCVRVCWSVWTLSVVTLVVLDIRTFAELQIDSARKCYICAGSNSNVTCSPVVTQCPNDKPHCGTIATSPNFTSSLACVETAESPCSLFNSKQKQTLTLKCRCTGDLCNAPYSTELLEALKTFTAIQKNETELLNSFLKQSKYNNDSNTILYEIITMKIKHEHTDVPSSFSIRHEESHIKVPKAEALKQEAVPSDDDDDEEEGSGSYEDSQKRLSSAPSAPSSYLPANKNSASTIYNFLSLILVSFCFCLLVV